MVQLVKSKTESKIRKLWMPIKKSTAFSSTYHAILSDNSIDRDYEVIAPELLKRWAETKALPALINHENKMEKLAGGWKNFRVLSNNNKHALVAELHIFKSNPNTKWIKNLIEEADEFGIPVGVSISAIPKAHINGNLEKDGYKRKWTDAELVEATLVPVPSNRGASIISHGYKSYDTIAKAFDIEKMEQDEIIEKKVVKRGNQWCVIHCHGPNAGKPIKCFDTKEEALRMHRAILANENKSCSNCNENYKEEFKMEEDKLKKQVEETPKEEPKKEEPQVEEKEQQEPEKEEKSLDIKAEIEKTVNEAVKKAVEELLKNKKEVEKEAKEKLNKEMNRKAELKGYFEESGSEKKIEKSISKEEYSLRDSLLML